MPRSKCSSKCRCLPRKGESTTYCKNDDECVSDNCLKDSSSLNKNKGDGRCSSIDRKINEACKNDRECNSHPSKGEKECVNKKCMHGKAKNGNPLAENGCTELTCMCNEHNQCKSPRYPRSPTLKGQCQKKSALARVKGAEMHCSKGGRGSECSTSDHCAWTADIDDTTMKDQFHSQYTECSGKDSKMSNDGKSCTMGGKLVYNKDLSCVGGKCILATKDPLNRLRTFGVLKKGMECISREECAFVNGRTTSSDDCVSCEKNKGNIKDGRLRCFQENKWGVCWNYKNRKFEVK